MLTSSQNSPDAPGAAVKAPLSHLIMTFKDSSSSFIIRQASFSNRCLVFHETTDGDYFTSEYVLVSPSV